MVRGAQAGTEDPDATRLFLVDVSKQSLDVVSVCSASMDMVGYHVSTSLHQLGISNANEKDWIRYLSYMSKTMLPVFRLLKARHRS